MLPLKLPWEIAQTRWASQLNPILADPTSQGNLLTNIMLIDGTTVINHGLGKVEQGWIITDQNAKAQIYRSQPFNNLTLTLVSDAAVTVSLWVY